MSTEAGVAPCLNVPFVSMCSRSLSTYSIEVWGVDDALRGFCEHAQWVFPGITMTRV